MGRLRRFELGGGSSEAACVGLAVMQKGWERGRCHRWAPHVSEWEDLTLLDKHDGKAKEGIM